MAVLLIAFVSLNTLRTHGVGSAGLQAGARLPPFAAPLAAGPVPDGDVNVARRAGQGQAGRRPACQVRGPGILNSCDLVRRDPAVIAFLATRGAQCTAEIDTLARAVRRHRGLRLAAVSIKGGRKELRGLVRSHDWRFPVAWDRDGILANLFGVAVCPAVTYVLPGGVVQGTSVGRLQGPRLDARLAALARAARAHGWRA
ncbi:MAG: TlpA family protein disulfide reductase [Solirubrobacteraceae bacterium]